MDGAYSMEELLTLDQEGHSVSAAAGSAGAPGETVSMKQKYQKKDWEKDKHTLVERQQYEESGAPNVERQPSLCSARAILKEPSPSPSTHFRKVYGKGEVPQQTRGRYIQQRGPPHPCEPPENVYVSRVEFAALTEIGYEHFLHDNRVKVCRNAPPLVASSSRPVSSLSASGCCKTKFGEHHKHNNVRRSARAHSSPLTRPRVQLCRVRNTPVSLCENCGTSFTTETLQGNPSYSGGPACAATLCNAAEFTSAVSQVNLTPGAASSAGESRGEPEQRSVAVTLPALHRKTAAADACVEAIAGGPARAATGAAAHDNMYFCNDECGYDPRIGSPARSRSKFSCILPTYGSWRRPPKQERQPHSGDEYEKERASRQPLPLARWAPSRDSCPTVLEEARNRQSAATYWVLEKGGKKTTSADIDGEVNERKCMQPKDERHYVFATSKASNDGAGSNSAQCLNASRDTILSYGSYSSTSTPALSPSRYMLSSSSAACVSSSAFPSAPRASSSRSALASPSISDSTTFNPKTEQRRRLWSIRDRCRSACSTSGTFSVETDTLTRAASSNHCSSSTYEISTSRSGMSYKSCGQKYFSNLYASYLGFTWGWAFQRHPRGSWGDYCNELKCGLGVALSQLPATLTCAIVANVPVANALHGAWITGLVTAIFGGSPLSVTTVTSSLAVTLAKVTRTVCDEKTNTCTDEGLEFIFPALILAGACVLLLGTLRLSRFSQFVPSSTIIGYLNAVAILNVKAQVVTFKFDPVTSTGYECLWVVLMITIVFFIMRTWENIPKIRINAFVPASVLALAVTSFIEFVLVRRVCGMQTKTAAALSNLANQDKRRGGTHHHAEEGACSLWPKPFFLTAANVQPFYLYFRLQDLLTTLELTFALVMVNYMSTLVTVDMLSDKSAHLHLDSKPDQHLVSVGLANLLAGFLGALPGSTAPSPSLLNLTLGSKSREGAVFAALVNFSFVAASPYFLDLVPLAGLAGIIMYTAYHAFQWRAVAAIFASFLPERLRTKHPLLQRKICRSDAFVMLLTTTVAVCADIGTAVLLGVCIASCVFAWKNAARLQVSSRLDADAGVKVYRVKGPIFFLTKRRLIRHFDVEKDPVSVILELSDEAEQLFDYGALESLDALVMRYKRAGKRLKVVGMQCGDRKMIVKAGRLFEFAQIELVEKPLEDSAEVRSIADMMKLPC